MGLLRHSRPVGRLISGLCAGFFAFGLLLSAAHAQSQPETTPAPSAQEMLDRAKQELDRIETTLRRPDLRDADLERLREDLEPAAESVSTALAQLQPRVDSLRARLAQLAPAPNTAAPSTTAPSTAAPPAQPGAAAPPPAALPGAAPAAPQPADATTEREARQAELSQVEEQVRFANALLVQAGQLRTAIADARRALLTNRLLARSPSPFNPVLWADAWTSLPRDLRALTTLATDWAVITGERIRDGRIVALAVPIAVGLGLLLLGRWLLPHITRRDPEAANPSRLKRVLVGAGIALGGTVPVAITALLLYFALDGIELLPGRLAPLARAILIALTFVTFARALADACFAPDLPAWRLIPMEDITARRLMALVGIVATLLLAHIVIDALLEATSASLPATVLTRSAFAIAPALACAVTLSQLRAPDREAECALGPYVPESHWNGPLRMLGWLAIVIVLAAVATGYVALAGFVVRQAVWASMVAGVIFVALTLVEQTIGELPRRNTRMALAIQSNVGLSRRSLEQLSVLAAGILKLTLILVGFLMVLAPFGVESNDIVPAARQALVGFTVGEVTISISAVLIALATFVLILGATRGIQRWMTGTFLPTTELDPGLRNSIATAFGYLGFFAAAAFGLAQLGLSLQNVAIVAGALSVGIGFGLQSIVNNFVSGLILLWERSIRVGDWVVVGTEQGYVRRISVRATEIETFDRAAVIVPNSNLVSGVVKNWLHNGRSGRFTIKVGVSYTADADETRDLLVSLAEAHPDVAAEPPPRVFLTGFGEKSVDFDLHCHVADVATAGRVKSELSFTILRELKNRDALPPR
jgi:small-conductance mechanosensitive channel